jgi:hypothetical protein
MNIQPINYRGRKGVVGNVCFGNEGLAFLAGYHECECGARGKILLNINDARALASKIGGGGAREPFGISLTKRLIRHYGI